MSINNKLAVAQEYEAKLSANADVFLDWIGMTRNGFDFILDQHRNKEIWERDGHYGSWRHSAKWRETQAAAAMVPDRLETIEASCSFRICKSKPICDQEEKFILVGKGDYLSVVETEALKICDRL
jgi:hypothetical protein